MKYKQEKQCIAHVVLVTSFNKCHNHDNSLKTSG